MLGASNLTGTGFQSESEWKYKVTVFYIGTGHTEKVESAGKDFSPLAGRQTKLSQLRSSG